MPIPRVRLAIPVFLALVQVACIFGGKDNDDTDAVIDDPGDNTTVSLTSSQFEDDFGDKVCDEWASCDATEPCSPAEWSNTLATQCDFDPALGQDCLDRDWVCTEGDQGHPSLEFPISCDNAYDC